MVILLFRLYLLKVNIKVKALIILLKRRLICACNIQHLKKILDREVMIYTISRDTPIDTLEKVKPADLERIAEMVGETGFSTQISA